MAFDVPTIIVDPVGLEYFGEYVGEGLCYFSVESKDIVSTLNGTNLGFSAFSLSESTVRNRSVVRQQP